MRTFSEQCPLSPGLLLKTRLDQQAQVLLARALTVYRIAEAAAVDRPRRSSAKRGSPRRFRSRFARYGARRSFEGTPSRSEREGTQAAPEGSNPPSHPPVERLPSRRRLNKTGTGTGGSTNNLKALGALGGAICLGLVLLFSGSLTEGSLKFGRPSKAEMRKRIVDWSNAQNEDSWQGIGWAGLKQGVGKPSRTQFVGGVNRAYWYYDCADGVLQLEFIATSSENLMYLKEINEY